MNEVNDFIYPLYAYRDNKASSFTPPFVCVNEAVAKRDFDYRLHNDKSMGFSPADYDLYQIGNFNTTTGEVKPMLPEFIINGGELF